MLDTVWIGSTPCNEDCAQVGEPDYARDAKIECRQFIEAIRKVCGHEPEGARLKITTSEHDWGTLYDVSVVYDTDNEKAAEYAYMVEDKAPQTWNEAGMQAPGKGRGR